VCVCVCVCVCVFVLVLARAVHATATALAIEADCPAAVPNVREAIVGLGQTVRACSLALCVSRFDMQTLLPVTLNP
jgi:hypothetical protein